MHATPVSTSQPPRPSTLDIHAAATSVAAGPAFRPAWWERLDQTTWRLRNLARRHGSTTGQQRRRLRHSVVRHVNEGDVGLDDAKDFLQTLGIEPVRGPDRISFRVPVALAMVHEDVETDIDTLEGLLDPGRMRWTRFEGCPGGYTITRPSCPDPDTERRRTVVRGDLRLTVTVRAHSIPDELHNLARHFLESDLARLQEDEIEILEDPTLWPDDIPYSDEPDSITDDHDYDEPALTDADPYPDSDEYPDEFDPTRPWRWSDRRTTDDPDGEADAEWAAD